MTGSHAHCHGGRVVAACLVAVVTFAAAHAQAPVAPEPTADAAGILPATHVEAAADARPSGAARLGPVPLPSGPATAAGPASATGFRDLGNWTILAALAASFAVLAAMRFRAGRRPVVLPVDVFELLGEAPLGGPHSARVVRFGPRTLLVGVSPAGCQTLAVIDDPQATECIVAACRGLPTRSRSAAASAGPAPSRTGGRGAAGVTA